MFSPEDAKRCRTMPYTGVIAVFRGEPVQRLSLAAYGPIVAAVWPASHAIWRPYARAMIDVVPAAAGVSRGDMDSVLVLVRGHLFRPRNGVATAEPTVQVHELAALATKWTPWIAGFEHRRLAALRTGGSPHGFAHSTQQCSLKVISVAAWEGRMLTSRPDMKRMLKR